MENIEDLNKGELIKADLYSRPNAINGKYKYCQLGEEDLDKVKSKDIFYLETLRMKADLADKMIAEAESQGKNLKNTIVMKELGEKINAVGTPAHRNESVLTSLFVCIRLIAYYSIAIGIWGVVLRKSLITFSVFGAILGLLICLMFVGPVIALQRIREKVKDMVFAASMMWGSLAIIIGVLALVAWFVRLLFT